MSYFMCGKEEGVVVIAVIGPTTATTADDVMMRMFLFILTHSLEIALQIPPRTVFQ